MIRISSSSRSMASRTSTIKSFIRKQQKRNLCSLSTCSSSLDLLSISENENRCYRHRSSNELLNHFSSRNYSSFRNKSFLYHEKSKQRIQQHPLLNNNVPTHTRNYSSSTINHSSQEIHRLTHVRNVGVFAHVDAGKTTVTERMLALAGIVHKAGSVDTGNTVTDYLPAERERGITIQSAAISFNWHWHNSDLFQDKSSDFNDEVTMHLIDTPGHVDFSVEVNRSVAVLDGAVLVVDAVAGVQAQTETVWRAMTRPSINNHETGFDRNRKDVHGHEPLPCIAFVNKMDKEGCNFGYALSTLKYKLQGANPVALQVPLFQVGQSKLNQDSLPKNIVAVPASDLKMNTLSHGTFVGVIDLIEMRAIVWPEVNSNTVNDVEECIPTVYNLLSDEYQDSQVKDVAIQARQDLVASLADVDETMEEYFLMEEDPTNNEIRTSLRSATLNRKVLPVMTGAALRGKGVEPLLDAMADLLPSPLNRNAPALMNHDENSIQAKKAKKKNQSEDLIPFGHPLHPSLLALAFKVVHMKNRGGSGDGRVVFARVYSGKISTRDSVKVISPLLPGEKPQKARIERVGGMLELAGGRFDNLPEATCYSGDVCALVGLKDVTTGDTILLASNEKGKKKKSSKKASTNDSKYEASTGNECLAGVGAPKPVLTVRVEAENAEQESKLMDALRLMMAEDPSLMVEETGSATLLSGLGELHIEVVVDRLQREHGLAVWIGKPSVAYRETVQSEIDTGGLVEYDRTVGSTRMQAQVHIRLESMETEASTSDVAILTDPDVKLGSKVKEYLGFDEDDDELELTQRCEVAKALVAGCKGALKRGPIGSFELANVRCYVEEIDSEGGLAGLKAMPGTIRAAVSSIVATTLQDNKDSCSLLEPTMSVEVSAPSEMVGTVLSDLTARNGNVGEVIMGDDDALHSKALIHGQVPLKEILGYANNLRSITGGEGSFSAEYKGHSPCDSI